MPSGRDYSTESVASSQPLRFGARTALANYNLLRGFRKDESGAVATVIAVSLTFLIGVVGLGVEVGAWYATKRHNQTAADAAALGAAYSKSATGDNSKIQASAVADAARNGVVDGGLVDITAISPPTSGNFTTESNAIQVTITEQPSLLFASMLGNFISLEVRSVSKIMTLGEACVLSLSPTAAIGIQLSGSANLNLNGCGMYSNATSATSMTTAGGQQLQVIADYFSMVGGYKASGSAEPVLDTKPPLTGQPPMADPFVNPDTGETILAAPAPGATFTNPSFGNGDTWAGELGSSANAPFFNNGLTFGSQANITIPASVTEVYVKGELKINAGAQVNCTCTFILTDGGDGTAASKVTINGNANVNITAPSGAGARYSGIAFYNEEGTSSTDSKFAGTGNTNIVGAVYFPNQSLNYRGTSTGGANCTRIIAGNIVFIGDTGSTLTGGGSNCPKLPPGSGTLIAPSLPVLVE